MQIDHDDIATSGSAVTQCAYEIAFVQDLKFLNAWEDGHFPELCSYLRVRQIRKANPVLTHRLQKK